MVEEVEIGAAGVASVEAVEDLVAIEEDLQLVVGVEEEEKTKKNGFPSPSLADWSKMERSRAWKKSTSSLCPSR